MKKSIQNVVLGMASVAAIAGGQSALAYEPGDMIVRVGFATVDPRESSDKIDVLGIQTLDGVGLNSDTQIGLTGTYFVTKQLAVEVLAATPFEHDINVNGTAVKAGTTKHLPPTVTLTYYPMDASSVIQPYVGIGINYTVFFDETVDQSLDNELSGIATDALETETVVNADLELDDSIGLAFQAGVDYKLTDNWSVNAAVWRIDIATEATIKTALGDVKFDVDVDPWAYMIAAAYKF
jgi:outer membrane protein